MNVFSLVGKITVNYADAVDGIEKMSKAAEDAAESLEDVDKKADNAGNSVEDSGDAANKANDGFTIWKGTLANLASKAIADVIQKCEELGSKLVDLTQTAVGNYAEYEQLAGGAQLMFGDAYDYIVEKAENAYKTVQLSQNDYLEQVNGFAVGLKTALGGNEQAAAELADRIVSAEADIVAATGNTQENVQNAFNGIMKSNYTMLDNLQIGITPTKEGFQEIIDKVNEWNTANGEATSYAIDNLADCQNALVDYIEMQGLSGYAAGEASTTIQGSWSSVQALFENILTKVGGELAPTIMDFLNELSAWMETVDWDEFAGQVGDAFGGILDWLEQIDFEEAFNDGMEGVQSFLDILESMSEKLPEVIAFIDEWGAGVAAFIGTIVGVEAILKGITIAQTALNIAMNANPILLIVTLVAGLIVALVTLWNTNEDFRNAVTSAWETIKEAVGGAIDAVVEFFGGLGEKLSQKWEEIKNAVSVGIEAIKGFFAGIIDFISNNWQSLLLFIVNPFAGAFSLLYNNCEAFREFINNLLETVKTIISNAWEAIKTKIATVMTAIQTLISTIWNAIKTVITTVINAIKTVITTVFTAIKTTITTIWNAIKTTISNAINNVKTTISNGLNAAKTTVSNILNSIKDKFSSIFESAKSIVGGAIEKIKGFFNFSWSLPSLKLPHFSIEGSFSLNPPSVPHFSIDWYKKAMEDGMIMNQPTIFGYNPRSNQFLAGGESGSETVVGTQSLLDMIKSAVNEENGAISDGLQNILAMLDNFLPQMADMRVVMDSGALVGALAPGMDTALGKLADHNGRGIR